MRNSGLKIGQSDYRHELLAVENGLAVDWSFLNSNPTCLEIHFIVMHEIMYAKNFFLSYIQYGAVGAIHSINVLFMLRMSYQT